MSCERLVSRVAIFIPKVANAVVLAVSAFVMLAPASISHAYAQVVQAAQAAPSNVGKDDLKSAPSDSAAAASGSAAAVDRGLPGQQRQRRA